MPLLRPPCCQDATDVEYRAQYGMRGVYVLSHNQCTPETIVTCPTCTRVWEKLGIDSQYRWVCIDEPEPGVSHATVPAGASMARVLPIGSHSWTVVEVLPDGARVVEYRLPDVSRSV